MELGKLEYLISVKTGNIDSELKKSETKVKKFGDKLSAWTIAKGQMIARFGEKMISSTASAMKNTIQSAVSSFADYEQLVGGIDTLFKDSSQRVQDYASQAFKTVGISANEYMETVTSFSASLLQSLGNDTDKAADVSDMAMKDMADNMNKMGSSMDSIQNAYRGFAKQNYTMLDNLKLGYGGTKTEMQRLLKDASKLSGQKYNIKNLKDVYEAIHVIQTEMGITGTTQKEAMTTITGSMNATKAAWKDVLTSIGRGKDVKKSIKNFAETAKVALKNVKPVISTAVKGFATTIKELVPEISKELPGLISDILPDLISTAGTLVGNLAKAIVDNAPKIIDGFGEILRRIGHALEDSSNPVLQGAGKLVTFFGNLIRDPKGTIEKAWNTVWGKISSLAESIWEGIKSTASNVWEAIKGFWTQNIVTPISKAWGAVATWFDENVWQPIKKFFEPVWEYIKQLWSNISSSIQSAWEKVYGILEPIIAPIRDLFQGVVNVVSEIWDTLKGIFGLGNKTITVTTVYKEQGKKAAEIAEPLVEAGGLNNPDVQETARDNLKTGLGLLFGHAKGNWYVPYDNYPALLHRGEMVLNKSQARQLRDGEGNGGIDIGRAISEAFSKVYVMMSGEKVGDLTTKRVKNNINANSYSRIRAYGG